MPELRRDPTTGEWVVVAAERARRPVQRVSAAPVAARPEFDPACPFCPGNESCTPPEITRFPEIGDWLARLVPNKYPALGGTPSANGAAPPAPFTSIPALGRHEVIVEGRNHRPALASRDSRVGRAVLGVAQERCKVVEAENHASLVTVFKNHGIGSGASLTHPHWQLISTPVDSPSSARMLGVARGYYETTGRSVYDDVIAAELGADTRVIRAGEGFVVFCPYAPRWAGETWIVPTEAGASLTEEPGASLAVFAHVLRETLRRVEQALDDPDCNVVIVSVPQSAGRGAFRWHARIQPRMSIPAGLESASGVAVVSVSPEQSAKMFRDVTG